MKKVLFCQFHNYLINGKYQADIAGQYYNGIYQYREEQGYYKTNHFFELPLWIAELKGSIKNRLDTKLLIIENVQDSIKQIEELNPDYVCFSVLDVNKAFIHEIVKGYKGKALFVLGGYIDFTPFKTCPNVRIFDTIKGFVEYLGVNYTYDLDYSFFKGFKTVPRLTLSKGCLNRCKFCIVEKAITKTSKRDIIKQVRAFKDLDFKLVYLNDKTLGQCSNYKLLPLIYKRIKKYNPKFEGFIIQTTCNMFLKADYVNNLKECHIFACELGIETYNNTLLKGLRKPQNTKTIDNAIEQLKKLRIKIIPNIIIGIIGETRETYNNTLAFLNRNIKDIFLLNIYNLALYLDSDLAKDIDNLTDNDLNENITDKSFYNKQTLKNNDYFYNKIFKIGLRVLKQN